MFNASQVGEIFGQNLPPNTIKKWRYDSRDVGQGDAFVAYKCGSSDGHAFITDALNRGASLVLATELVDHPLVLVVEDTLAAMAKIARLSLEKFPVKTIAITGSVGKTSTKEMLRCVLASQFTTTATIGNQNNELGLPITVLNRQSDCEFLILEMGARKQGDISYLMDIALPQVGICTAIAAAHTEFYPTMQDLVDTKKCVYTHLPESGHAIVCLDDEYASEFKEQTPASVITCSEHDKHADVYIESQLTGTGILATISTQTESVTVNVNLLGAHFAKQIMFSAGVLVACSLPLTLLEALVNLKPFPGRMQPLSGARAQVIDDTYNASPSSVQAAIDYLHTLTGSTQLILGDMGELGDESDDWHRYIGSYATGKVTKLWTVGEASSLANEAFEGNKQHFNTKEDLVQVLQESTLANTILVKGSRFMKMEAIVESLINEKTPSC